jgi:hypothetical protein
VAEEALLIAAPSVLPTLSTARPPVIRRCSSTVAPPVITARPREVVTLPLLLPQPRPDVPPPPLVHPTPRTSVPQQETPAVKAVPPYPPGPPPMLAPYEDPSPSGVRSSTIAPDPSPGVASVASPSPGPANAWLGHLLHPDAPLVGRSTLSTAYYRAAVTPPIAVPETTAPRALICCGCQRHHRPNIEHWVQVLQEKFQVDGAGINRLRELAESGVVGYRQANRLIGKLLKAVNDDTAVRSRSAFIVTGVRNAWPIVHRALANLGPEPILVVNHSMYEELTLH